MLSEYSEIVEKARVRDGDFGTHPGTRFGAFFIRCKATGEMLTLIVGDGSDWKECGFSEPIWEHVSVSCERRCPTWQEMAFIKDLFFAPEECVVQFHPPKSKYVNKHQYVLHLWRMIGQNFPMPPIDCV